MVREIELDGRDMVSRKLAHDYLSSMLSLPEYYGRNLDALYDCLTETGGPLRLVLLHADAVIENLGAYGSRLLQVLADASHDNDDLVVEMRL